MGGFRIGHKVGKHSFVSIGSSGSYFSTWFGGFRISKFTPYKKTAEPKESEYKPKQTKVKDLTNCYLEDTGETYHEYKQRILKERRETTSEVIPQDNPVSKRSWFWTIFGLLGFIMIVTELIRIYVI